jgi:carbon-monoxide dehydrogenase medium subunit
MWHTYLQPVSLSETVSLLRQYLGKARVLAGGTNLLVAMQHGTATAEIVIDLSRLSMLRQIRVDAGTLRLGALVTPAQVLRSELCREHALPLVQACHEWGAPQIRNRATLGGNVTNASPVGDGIPPLIALDAQVVLLSSSGERTIPVADFITAPHATLLLPDELLTEIVIPIHATPHLRRGMFYKLGMRRAQVISVVNMACMLTFADEGEASPAPLVQAARIAVGGVAPTVQLAEAAAALLVGQRLTPELGQQAAPLVAQIARPIDDIHAPAAYRQAVLGPLVAHCLAQIATNQHTASLPQVPVVLGTAMPEDSLEVMPPGNLVLQVNGQTHHLPARALGKTLLTLLREDLGLTGTKQGCSEGRCGACTVWLNGQAVNACLVAAPQAHHARITTIEGLAHASGVYAELHPLQQAFIEQAAAQCGYCTPGMIMAGARLLADVPHPDEAQIRRGLSGNLCRCTGYQKIIAAIRAAAQIQPTDEVQP